MFRSIIELLLSINCLLISIKLIKLSDQIRRLEQVIEILLMRSDKNGIMDKKLR